MAVERLALAEDIDRLIEVRLDFFAAEQWEIPPEQCALLTANLREYYTDHLNLDFFAALVEINDEIVSTAFLAISQKPPGPSFPTGKVGTIFNVLTYPKHRNNGYAAKALKQLIDIGKREKLSQIELSATEMGLPLYQKLGFTPSPFTAMKLTL